MRNNTINRRQWIKNAGLTSLGCGSTLLGFSANSKMPPIHDQEQKIRLFYNENPYGPAPGALANVVKIAKRGNRYATFHSMDLNALKEDIAEREGVRKENILLGHGSFQLLIWLSEYFAEKKGEYLVPSPTFDVIGMYARRIGINVKPVEVNEQFEMNLPEMEKQVNMKTALVSICHPNNPTGTLVNPENLRRFCRRVSKKCPVIVDEAYIQYTDIGDWRKASMVDLVRSGENIIISRTFSKLYGMAGFRVGYLMAQPTLIDALTKRFTLGFPGNMPNTLSVAAAMGALADNTFLADSRKKNSTAKEQFYQELDALEIPYIKSQANFIYFDVNKFAAFKKMMNEKNILLAGGWPSKPNWARVTMGSREDMEVFYPLLRSKAWL